MKRTKNQGGGIVDKAQFSDFLKIFASRRFILFAPELPINSSISVRSQNPTIAMPEVILN